MKTLFLAALLLFAHSAHAENWSDADRYREAAYLTLHVADWAQTRYAMRQEHGFREANPILGNHPHENKIDVFAIMTALAHVWVAHIIPKKHRNVFQYVSIGIKVGIVANNYSVGAKIQF